MIILMPVFVLVEILMPQSDIKRPAQVIAWPFLFLPQLFKTKRRCNVTRYTVGFSIEDKMTGGRTRGIFLSAFVLSQLITVIYMSAFKKINSKCAHLRRR